jgi:hypothetical protein
VLKFTPPKKIGAYALYVESNYGSHFFRTYNDLGHLKNAFYHHTNMYLNFSDSATSNNAKILEMVDGDWYVLYEVPKGTKRDDIPWMRKQYRALDYAYYGRLYDEKPEGVNSDEVVRSKPMPIEDYVKFRIAVHEERRCEGYANRV